MSLLDRVYDEQVWREFYEYKRNSGHLNRREAKELLSFIDNHEYSEFDKAARPKPPQKLIVNKQGTTKKRVVYTFEGTENYILKLISYLLYEYDDRLSDSCYSFRRHSTAKKAISNVLRVEGIASKYVLKADIHNYFNSIPADRLADELSGFIDDGELLCYLQRLLRDDRAVDVATSQMEIGNRGAMAGIPVSPFFANVYLKSLDDMFEKMKVPYFRYSDDILIFADTREQIDRYLKLLTDTITEKGLELNPQKVVITEPGCRWDFLGFCYNEGKIDLSEVTKTKMKAKIKRKAKSLYRRRIRKKVDFETSATAMIKAFNRKLYDEKNEGNFTWSRWFFPVLTSSKGLKELDHYMLEYIRFLDSGRHYKGNYRVTYESIKEMGYRSLVHEYYKGRENEGRNVKGGT